MLFFLTCIKQLHVPIRVDLFDGRVYQRECYGLGMVQDVLFVVLNACVGSLLAKAYILNQVDTGDYTQALIEEVAKCPGICPRIVLSLVGGIEFFEQIHPCYMARNVFLKGFLVFEGGIVAH